MEHYKHLPESPVGGYALVHGPDGFNAMADSFEDAVTFTCRLDQQLAELAALSAEVERLRATNAELKKALQELFIVGPWTMNHRRYGEIAALFADTAIPPGRDWYERKIPHDEGEVGAGLPAPPVEEE